MKYSEVKKGRKFQLGSDKERFSDVMIRIDGEFSVDPLGSVHYFAPDTPVAECVETEQVVKSD